MLNLKNIVLEMLEKSKVSRSKKSSISCASMFPHVCRLSPVLHSSHFPHSARNSEWPCVLAQAFKMTGSTLLSELIPALLILAEPLHRPRQCKMQMEAAELGFDPPVCSFALSSVDPISRGDRGTNTFRQN